MNATETEKDKHAALGPMETLGIHSIQNVSIMAASYIFNISPPIVELCLNYRR